MAYTRCKIKKPWLKFWVGRWMSDPHLRCCDLAARGALVDLMALSHDGQPYGYLTNGGMAISDKDIVRVLGCFPQTWRKARKQLIDKGRLGWCEEMEAYFVPSMVRDGQRDAIAAENGARGGNPNLLKGAEKTGVGSKRGGRGSKSSSTQKKAAKAVEGHTEPQTEIPKKLNKRAFRAMWAKFLAMRVEIGCEATGQAQEQLLATLEPWGAMKATQSLATSIRSQYRDVFEPRTRDGVTTKGAASTSASVLFIEYAERAVAIHMDATMTVAGKRQRLLELYAKSSENIGSTQTKELKDAVAQRLKK